MTRMPKDLRALADEARTVARAGLKAAITGLLFSCWDNELPVPSSVLTSLFSPCANDFRGLRNRFVRWAVVRQFNGFPEPGALKATWEQAYDLAEEKLAETDAKGTSETMRAAYKSVEKAFKMGDLLENSPIAERHAVVAGILEQLARDPRQRRATEEFTARVGIRAKFVP